MFIYRFFTTGSFGGAAPTVNVPAGGYSYVDSSGNTQAIATGTLAVVDASDPIGNQADSDTFTVAPYAATLAAVGPGATISSDSLNNLGYFDVQISVPAYAVAIDQASMATLTPKLIATVNNPGAGTLTLDPTQAPTLVSVAGNVYIYRFWYSGTYRGPPSGLSIHFIGNSFNFLDASGQPIPDFANEALTIGKDGSNNLYVDVPFGASASLNGARRAPITISGATITSFKQSGPPGTYRFFLSGAGLAVGNTVTAQFNAGMWTYADASNGSVQDPSVVMSPSATATGGAYIDVTFPDLNGVAIDPTSINGDEFTLSGAGAQGVSLTGTPLLIAQTDTSSTYRYFLTGTFAAGAVNVSFTGNWTDMAGDLGTPGSESFQVTAPLEPPAAGQLQSQAPAFFISVSGELELSDPTGTITQPLVDIFGQATLDDRRRGRSST